MIYFYFLNERSPLHKAVEKENLEIIKLLLSNKNLEINFKNVLLLNFK